jgi:NAD-dependent SIR2 family protein deacetylase
MKKKLLITVGAGASIEFGMPSVATVDSLFDTHAGKEFSLSSEPTTNLYRYCRDTINGYYSKSSKPALAKTANFEEVLYQLNLLCPYLSDKSHKHGSNALLSASALPDVLHFGKNAVADADILRHLSSSSLDMLVNHFIGQCALATHQKAAEIAQLKKFLDALSDEFDIGIITLNYDNMFTQARPSLYTGFDPISGQFDPRGVFSRPGWEFIYHLHGSIHFNMNGRSRGMHEISWEAHPATSSSTSSFGRNTQDSMEGTDFPTSTIIAGYGKTQQMLRQPFRTYYSQANRLIHQADSLLFLGYGFSDLHLNAIFSEVDSQRVPSVLVDWAPNDQDSLPHRFDDWSYNLGRTLSFDASHMSAPGHVAPASIGELKQDLTLEVSNDPKFRLAVWYNGMVEATKHPDKILAHLM